jgi:hypothetical protein
MIPAAKKRRKEAETTRKRREDVDFWDEKRRKRGVSLDGIWWTRRRGRVLPALGCGYDSNSRHRSPAKTQTKSNTAILDNKVLIIDEQTLRQTDRREAKEGGGTRIAIIKNQIGPKRRLLIGSNRRVAGVDGDGPGT